MATHSSILAWRIPWTEEPADYSPQSLKELDTTEEISGLSRYFVFLYVFVCVHLRRLFVIFCVTLHSVGYACMHAK